MRYGVHALTTCLGLLSIWTVVEAPNCRLIVVYTIERYCLLSISQQAAVQG